MGFFGGGTAVPPAIPPVPPAAHPAVLGSQMAITSSMGDQAAAGAAAGMGFDGTIKTTPGGLTTPPTTAKATLLGQ